MITSVTFRHRTEYKLLRSKIEKECNQILASMPDITGVNVVFDKEINKKSLATSISCHISMHLNHKKHIDIFEYHRNEHLAFEQAFEHLNNYLQTFQIKQTHHEKLHLANKEHSS